MDSWRMSRLFELMDKSYKPYTNWFRVLKPADWREMLAFLVEHDHLSVDDFQYKLNRHFLEFELRFKRPKPPNWAQVDEILGNINIKRGADGSQEKA